ncbi:adenosylmethionine--8-amino-7-oxononanoate transaminase [Aureliella helgolandensis]|uniref:Adenosylmethionine-8-amino-7-oxononanoate aminotransferase n=1 Tax=Aureliella helgolandensis TaxID=2527968 RepID=A0A518GH52_9BACT|nr:adenosylmethionine--8-amino-7-oxononanoate transaminase [Aureliella helgolandensis]QDV27917.1 L-Lysine-8-amino-7-oxononanoate aminotransferase [Aureliella helgolandensis]
MSEEEQPRSAIDDRLLVDREHCWHAFTQMAEYEPLLVDRAEGVWLYDHQGRALLDGISSMWCNVHGHRHPKIDAAIRGQLDRVAHVTSLGMSNSTTIELTRRLVEVTPQGLDCIFYSSDGSSAVEVALKMAFQYWRQRAEPEPERSLFLAVGNAYHGDTLGSVSVGGVSRFHAMFDPLLFDVLRGPCPDTYRLPEGVRAEDACQHYLDQYEDLLNRFSGRIAALVVEPLVQGAAGLVMHPAQFLSGLRKLTREHGVLLIADEIAVGMGRTGKLWACEWEQVEPDFLCTGKGLSGGYLPVAATLTTREVWNAFLGDYAESKSFFHGHTFGGNPLGCAASLATLDLFEEEQTLQNVLRQGAYLEECLADLREHRHVGDVRCRGLVAAVELVENQHSQRGYEWSQRRGHLACQAAMERGVWLRPLGNVIVIMPPLCCTAEHIDQIVAAVKFGVSQACGD